MAAPSCDAGHERDDTGVGTLTTEDGMKTAVAAVVLLIVAAGLVGCKSLPGADGEYATHDRGYNNRGP